MASIACMAGRRGLREPIVRWRSGRVTPPDMRHGSDTYDAGLPVS
jgi:hypothetical protein